MTGTQNQIEWAEKIKVSVSGEFDRVANALKEIALKQTGQDQVDTNTSIAILEENRAAVMAREDAGYFIRDWQDLNDQVRKAIARDPRQQAMRAARVARADSIREI